MVQVVSEDCVDSERWHTPQLGSFPVPPHTPQDDT